MGAFAQLILMDSGKRFSTVLTEPIQSVFVDSEFRLGLLGLDDARNFKSSVPRLEAEDSEILYQFLASQSHLTHLMLSTSREWDSWLGFHPFSVLPTVCSFGSDGYDAPLLLQCSNVRSLTPSPSGSNHTRPSEAHGPPYTLSPSGQCPSLL
jgi:hypothetical protein